MSIAYALTAGATVSLVSLSGAFVLWLPPERREHLVPNLVALAVAREICLNRPPSCG
ncbi:hypothetical protein [Candidatus Methylocalor cossyra]